MKRGTSAPSRLCLYYRSRFALAHCSHSEAAGLIGRTRLSGVYSRAKVGQSCPSQQASLCISRLLLRHPQEIYALAERSRFVRWRSWKSPWNKNHVVWMNHFLNAHMCVRRWGGGHTETGAAKKSDGWNIWSKVSEFWVGITCAEPSWLEISRPLRTERRRWVWVQLERGGGPREEEVMFEGAEVGTVTDYRWRWRSIHRWDFQQ